MNAPSGQALTQALALLRSPRGARPGPAERLPDGMLQLLRIVAGDEQALWLAQQSSDEPSDSLREAAKFFIQQVMFAPGSHSYRVLGVEAGVTDEKLREHHRWLVRWLHPDRNPDTWEAVYADRVNKAWQDLRSPERRERYDASLLGPVELSSERVRAYIPVAPIAQFAEAPAPGRSLRWLPAIIFAGLGVSATVAISLFYALHWIDQRPPEQAIQSVAVTEPSEVSLVLPTPAPVVVERPAVELSAPMPRPTPINPPPTSAPAVTQPSTSAPADAPRSSSVRTIATSPPPEPRPIAREHLVPIPLPPSAPRPEPARAPIAGAETIDARVANQLLGQFSQAYSEGDVNGLREMFAADAHGPTGGLNAILADYSRLFQNSEERSMGVRDVSWFTTGATLTIIASYEATVATSRNRRGRRTRGDLRMDLRLVDEQWRIYRLQHDVRGG